MFKFESKDDRDWKTKNGPWLFDRNLIVIETPKEDQRATDIKFNKEDFWLRILNLPIGYRNEMVARKIGDKLGEFLKMDRDENRSIWGNNIRIKVRLNISNPLRRGLCLRWTNQRKTTG